MTHNTPLAKTFDFATMNSTLPMIMSLVRQIPSEVSMSAWLSILTHAWMSDRLPSQKTFVKWMVSNHYPYATEGRVAIRRIVKHFTGDDSGLYALSARDIFGSDPYPFNTTLVDDVITAEEIDWLKRKAGSSTGVMRLVAVLEYLTTSTGNAVTYVSRDDTVRGSKLSVIAAGEIVRKAYNQTEKTVSKFLWDSAPSILTSTLKGTEWDFSNSADSSHAMSQFYEKMVESC